MPRGKRGFPIKQARNTPEAIENLAVHHVLAIRQTTRGEITAVKHVAYGWLSVKEYGQLILLKDMEPTILEIIKGGYRIKAVVWASTFDVQIAASGVAIPFAYILIGVAVILYGVDSAAGRKNEALLDLAALALPFGELWLLYHGANYIASAVGGATSQIGKDFNAIWQWLTGGLQFTHTKPVTIKLITFPPIGSIHSGSTLSLVVEVDGNAVGPVFTAWNGLPPGDWPGQGTGNVRVIQGNVLTGTPTAAGTYTVNVDYSDVGRYIAGATSLTFTVT